MWMYSFLINAIVKSIATLKFYHYSKPISFQDSQFLVHATKLSGNVNGHKLSDI